MSSKKETKEVKEEVKATTVKSSEYKNFRSNYNHDEDGVITRDFLNFLIKQYTTPRYLVVRGMFNVDPNPFSMSLQDILNHMDGKGYDFMMFSKINEETDRYKEFIFKYYK